MSDTVKYFFVSCAAGNHKTITNWLNSLMGKDTTFLAPHYSGDGMPIDGQVVDIANWYVVPRADGAFVAFVLVAVEPHEE